MDIHYECYRDNDCSSYCTPQKLKCGSLLCGRCAITLLKFKCRFCSDFHEKNEYMYQGKNEASQQEQNIYIYKEYQNVRHKIEGIKINMLKKALVIFNTDNLFKIIVTKV